MFRSLRILLVLDSVVLFLLGRCAFLRRALGRNLSIA